jgi:transposase
VLDGRERETLEAFYRGLTPGQLASITSVSMDFWDPFIRATLAQVPQAEEKIVHDLFHLVQKTNRAVDEVRRQEHAELRARGDRRLHRTRYAWLYAVENRPEEAAESAQAAIEANLRTARAWGYKEALREIFRIATRANAEPMLRHWVTCVRRTRMEPLRKFAASLSKHLRCVLNYFHRGRTNAESESLNSRLQALITKSCGYRNRERFKHDAYFHFGNLDLFPGPVA